MKLAIVGSTRLVGRTDVLEFIHEVIKWLRPDVLISGGARGVDRMVRQVALSTGLGLIELLPEVEQWIDKSGKGRIGYKDRNLSIAQECDALIRLAFMGATTYGSGWTRDVASRLGKPVAEKVFS